MANALMSELDAVNVMFATIGEAPINDITSQHPHISMARNVLSQQLREFLSNGWSFNTELNVSLSVDTNNNIIIPVDVLKIEPASPADKYRYARRTNLGSHMLYDIINRTFDLSTSAITSLKVHWTLALNFGELTFSAQNYVAKASARKFQNKTLSSETVYKMSKEEEFEAYRIFLTEELDRANYNLLTDNNLISYIRSPAWV